MYYIVEQLVDYYGWTVEQAKKLSFREREHWFSRVRVKKESLRDTK